MQRICPSRLAAFRITLASALLTLFFLQPALAQWRGNGAPVTTATADQLLGGQIEDGAGNFIATWYSNESGNNDIYAQKFDAEGKALWTAGGVVVCNATGNQINPLLTTDGAGGAIIVWSDDRVSAAQRDIYVQRLNASGVPQWTANGVGACTATNQQSIPEIVSDGAGGAIIVWSDSRSGTNTDIYGIRLNASGAVTSGWGVVGNGIVICNQALNQTNQKLIASGTGGAIVTWLDNRVSNQDIYAIKLTGTGAAASGWGSVGVGIAVSAVASVDRIGVNLTTDGADGAIIGWGDSRGATNMDIYAARITALGVFTWGGGGGQLICNATDFQAYPELVADGANGAFIVWPDQRAGGFAQQDIYGKRVNAGGGVLGGWGSATDGIPICNATGPQFGDVKVIADGAGGILVSWGDRRNGSDYNVFASRLSPAGGALWGANGTPVCIVTGDQANGFISRAANGNVYVAWTDNRSGNQDVYAQRIGNFAVTITANSGAGSLRQAITDVNSAGGNAVIWFSINAAGVQTIGGFTGPYPNITVPNVTIDGYTQHSSVINTLAGGNNAAPTLEINGTGAGAGASGFSFNASGGSIRGMIINRFGASGIEFIGASGNVQGCFIGTNSAGTGAQGNSNGISVSANGCQVGGAAPEARNVISGNTEGIGFGGTNSGGSVLGNFIGTDKTGTLPVGNTSNGVLLSGSTTNTTVGDGTANGRNLISGNTFGVQLTGTGATNNVVRGNTIGADISGTLALPNNIGIFVANAPNNTIGGGVAGQGNLIGGNTSDGISITGSGASGNKVQGNRIGTNAAGTAALGNGADGIETSAGATNTVIGTNSDGTNDATEGNLISGNGDNGIRVSSPGTVITGNRIGTDAGGNASIGNFGNGGVYLFDSNNRVGTDANGVADALEGNLISGNINQGVIIDGNLNTVAGNTVGLNAAGTTDLGNGSSGIAITGTAANNTIGGTTAVSRNVLTGNNVAGIRLNGSGSGNGIFGNYIGTDKTGAIGLGNTAAGITTLDITGSSLNIGGALAGQGNVISGNPTNIGIGFSASSTTAITVQGNLIGTQPNGAALVSGSQNYGVLVSTGGVGVSYESLTIGGTTTGSLAGSNTIAYHAASGIEGDEGGGGTVSFVVATNSIFSNGLVNGKGINLINGANSGLSVPPIVLSVSTTSISGTVPVGSVGKQIRVYTGKDNEGRTLLGEVTRPAVATTWSITGSFSLSDSVTATYTEFQESSEFSAAVASPVLPSWTVSNGGIAGGTTLNGVAASSSVALLAGSGGSIYKSTNGGASWSLKASGTPNALNSIALPPNSTLSGKGASGVQAFGTAVSCGVGGTILRSTDGGETWIDESGTTTNTLNDVAVAADFSVARQGASGVGVQAPTAFGTAISCGVGGTILRSTDGGETWTVVPVATASALNGVAIADNFEVAAQNSNGVQSPTAFGTAISCGVGGTILRSTDGGETWIDESGTTTNTLNDVDVSPNIAAASLTGKSGYAAQSPAAFGTAISCGVGGTILRSTDGGETWAVVSSPVTTDLNAVQIVSETEAYLSGANGVILKSTDGGASWTQQPTPTAESLNAVLITANGLGIAVGTNSIALVSNNGGDVSLPVELASFSASPSAQSITLGWTTASETNNRGFILLRGEVGSAAGDVSYAALSSYETEPSLAGQGTSSEAHRYSFIDATATAGIVYRYKLRSVDISGTVHDYTLTAEASLSAGGAGQVNAWELSQNYPNPFNPTTTIRYAVRDAGAVRLELFNALGQQVRTLVSEVKAAGIYETSVRATNLPSGIYFYRLTASGFSETKKMLLVK